MKTKTPKYVFFKTEAAARRFLKLYGYKDTVVEHVIGGNWYRDFILIYFGPKTNGKFLVEVRASSEETEEWKLGEIEEKRWSGHKCYVFEG